MRLASQPHRRCAAPPLTQGRLLGRARLIPLLFDNRGLSGGRDRLPCVRGAGAARRLRGCRLAGVAREREMRLASQPHRRCAAPPLTQGRLLGRARLIPLLFDNRGLSGGRDRLPCVRGAGAARRLRGCRLAGVAREREMRLASQPHRRCAAPPLTQGRLLGRARLIRLLFDNRGLFGGRERLPCVRGAGAVRRLRGCRLAGVAREREMRLASQPHRRCAAPPLAQGRLLGRARLTQPRSAVLQPTCQSRYFKSIPCSPAPAGEKAVVRWPHPRVQGRSPGRRPPPRNGGGFSVAFWRQKATTPRQAAVSPEAGGKPTPPPLRGTSPYTGAFHIPKKSLPITGRLFSFIIQGKNQPNQNPVISYLKVR